MVPGTRAGDAVPRYLRSDHDFSAAAGLRPPTLELH
jgi:hypothetical protein